MSNNDKLKDKKHVVQKPKTKEKLSEIELLELMGVHRDRYKRERGRVKRK